MDIGPAFYKKSEDGELLYGPNNVFAPTFTLTKELKDTYDLPVDGWHWFETEAEAREFFELPPQEVQED
jgi:hypothetical protein